MRVNLPKLYPITDARLARLTHREQVTRLANGGASFIQLREKHLSPREFYKQAEEALSVAHELGARLIINDRVDIALALRADGVHLGQTDLEPEAARRVLGEGFIIGYSTHNLEQAVEAVRLPIDYLAVGPVFATTSKENPDPMVGLEGLSRIRLEIGDFPLVAIGGITRENARSVIEAGADSVAVIGALLSEPAEIESRTKEFISSL